MNLGEARTRSAFLFRDEEFVVVTAAQWTGHINEANRQFHALGELAYGIATSDVVLAAGIKIAVLAAGVLANLREVFDVTNQVPLTRQPSDMGIRDRIFLEHRNTKPLYYRVHGDQLSVMPGPKAGCTLRLYQSGDPAALVADGDSPTFPVRYHDALVYKALELAHREDQNAAEADRYRAMFERLLSAAADDPELRRPEQPEPTVTGRATEFAK